MKKILTFICCCLFVLMAENVLSASARCVVIESEKGVLTMSCGTRADGFPRGTKVKIKTDRD